MDFALIVPIIEKGLVVIGELVAAEQTVAPVIKTLLDLIVGAKNGTVTDEQLTATEALLDAQIDEFNLDVTYPSATPKA